MKNKKIVSLLLFSLLISLGFNGYFVIAKISKERTQKASLVIDDATTIKDIGIYLDSISDSYTGYEQVLANGKGIPSWGCGPSSYALAKILNKKFFNDKLLIRASYTDHQAPYIIIQRFGLADNNKKLIDHSWLEVYFNDKFLFIDPSIGQFGKIHTIAYETFSVGDPKIKDVLTKKYGIIDVRLSRLIPKVVDRIPVEQEPYPGFTIDKESLSDFLKILEDRNDVNDGIEPPDWKEWVLFLTNHYLSS